MTCAIGKWSCGERGARGERGGSLSNDPVLMKDKKRDTGKRVSVIKPGQFVAFNRSIRMQFHMSADIELAGEKLSRWPEA